MWVSGSSFQPSLEAVVAPRNSHLLAWAQKAGLKGDLPDICRAPEARAHVLSEVVAAGA